MSKINHGSFVFLVIVSAAPDCVHCGGSNQSEVKVNLTIMHSTGHNAKIRRHVCMFYSCSPVNDL